MIFIVFIYFLSSFIKSQTEPALTLITSTNPDRIRRNDNFNSIESLLAPEALERNSNLFLNRATTESVNNMFSTIAAQALREVGTTRSSVLEKFDIPMALINKNDRNSLESMKAFVATNYASESNTVAVNALAQAVAVCQINTSCDKMIDSYNKTVTYQRITATASQNATAAAEFAYNSYLNADKLMNSRSASMSERNNAKSAKKAAESAKKFADQTTMIAQASATASANCQMMVNLTCINYNSPPPSNFFPILKECSYLNEMSCSSFPSFYPNLPESFYLDNNYKHVVVGNENNNYLSCSINGELTLKEFSPHDINVRWISTSIGGSIITLRSYNGGYLTIDEDGKVSCNSKVLCHNNYFDAILSSKLCQFDSPNYVALRSFSGNYLSIGKNQITSKPRIYSPDELMKGYKFKRSNCDIR